MDRIIMVGAAALGVYFLLGGHLDKLLGMPGQVVDDATGMVKNVMKETQGFFDDVTHPFDHVPLL